MRHFMLIFLSGDGRKIELSFIESCHVSSLTVTVLLFTQAIVLFVFYFFFFLFSLYLSTMNHNYGYFKMCMVV